MKPVGWPSRAVLPSNSGKLESEPSRVKDRDRIMSDTRHNSSGSSGGLRNCEAGVKLSPCNSEVQSAPVPSNDAVRLARKIVTLGLVC